MEKPNATPEDKQKLFEQEEAQKLLDLMKKSYEYGFNEHKSQTVKLLRILIEKTEPNVENYFKLMVDKIKSL